MFTDEVNYYSRAAFSPDGALLAGGGTDWYDGRQVLALWAASSGHQLWSFTGPSGLGKVGRIAFSPDGALLASTSMDGTVILSRVPDGLQVAPPQPGFIDKMLKDRTPSVLAFSPDSRLLACAGSNGTVVTCETPDLRYRQVVQGHQGPVERIVFSPDSTMLASAGRDGVVRLWDVAKGAAAQLAPVGRAKKGHAGRVSSLAFSSGGHWLASGDRDAVLIWDVSRTRSWRGALKFWLQSISCVAFSPDGRTIASGNEEGSITLWSVTSDVPVIAQLQDGHDEPVESVAFSPDGRRLASASRDMTVLLFFDSGYTEGVLGFGYRPVAHDRLNVLAKYTYFYNLPGTYQVRSQGTATQFLQKSHIGSLDVTYDLTEKWTLGGKYAYRRGEVSLDRVKPQFFDNDADLFILRADYRFRKDRETSLEGRSLYLPSPYDQRSGAVFTLYRYFGKHFKLGVGYNFTDYSDDLTDLDYDRHGFFVNLVGTL